MATRCSAGFSYGVSYRVSTTKHAARSSGKKTGMATALHPGPGPAVHSPLFAVRVVRPFLDDPLRLPAAAVVPDTGNLAFVPGLLLVIIVLFLSGGGSRFLLRCRPYGLLRVAPVVVPPAPVMAGAVPPVIPPLPGSLALRGPVLLSLLRLLRRGGWLRRGRRLLPGALRLRIFICHGCQTD